MPQATTAKQAKKEIVGRRLESETYVYTVPDRLLPEGCKTVAVFSGDNLKKRLPKTTHKQSHELCDGLFAATNRIDYIRVTQQTQKRAVVEVQLKAGMKGSTGVQHATHSALEKHCGYKVRFAA